LSEFKPARLNDLLDVLIDYRGKTPPKTPSGVRLVTAKCIKAGTIFNESAEYISEGTYALWMKRGMPMPGDVLVTTEAPLGEVARVPLGDPIALAQRVILLRANERDLLTDYLYCAMRSAVVQDRLRQRSSGTTVAGIRQSELRQVEIPLPSIEVQCKIANILAAFDELIANSARRIEIVEEIVRSMYRECFAQEGFPGSRAQAEPWKSTGERPESLLRLSLGELCGSITDSVDPQSLEPSTPAVGLEHLPRRSTTMVDWGRADELGSRKFRFVPGDVLFGKIRPYLHKVAVAAVGGVCSTDAIVLRAHRSELAGVVIAVVSSDDFVGHAVQTSNGTKMPRADWKVLARYPVTLPSDDAAVMFSEQVITLTSAASALSLQNRCLCTARDALLPRLVAGQLDVDSLAIDDVFGWSDLATSRSDEAVTVGQPPRSSGKLSTVC